MTTDDEDAPKPREPSRAELGQMVFRGHGGRRPRVLAHGSYSEKHLVLDDRYVYWTDQGDGTITRLPKDGGVPLVIATDQAQPKALVRHDGSLYWATHHERRPEKGLVVRMPVEGGDVQALASGQDYPCCLAVRGRDVYWGNLGDGNLGTVMRGSVDGARPVTLATKQKRPSSIAVDDENVYWTCFGNKRPSYFTDGSFMRMPHGGSKRWVVAKDQSMPDSVVMDETHVYWTTSITIDSPFRPGRILKRPRSGGKTTTLVTWRRQEGRLALDDTHVYWFSSWHGDLFRVPKAGGDPEQLLSAEERFVGVSDFAVDDRFVYWTAMDSAGAGGAVWKMPK